MRTLKFIVDGQTIKQDPNCDFSGIVPGTSGYLQAEFSFSKDWNGYAAIATFSSIMGRDYRPEVIKGNKCIIPAEALTHRAFRVRVTGGIGATRIHTNNVTVVQDGGKS